MSFYLWFLSSFLPLWQTYLFCRMQAALGTAELAAAKKLSENEARVSELTDRWKDRWKETQKILEVRKFPFSSFLLKVNSLISPVPTQMFLVQITFPRFLSLYPFVFGFVFLNG